MYASRLGCGATVGRACVQETQQILSLVYTGKDVRKKSRCVLHSKSQNTRSVMSLEQRHSLLAYVWEAVLFTYWPCNLKEAWYSTTNSICIMACCGIVCSGVVFIQKRLNYVPPDVAHLSAGRLWDYTTQVRKLCVVLFYVQPIFLVVCGLIYARANRASSKATKLFLRK